MKHYKIDFFTSYLGHSKSHYIFFRTGNPGADKDDPPKCGVIGFGGISDDFNAYIVDGDTEIGEHYHLTQEGADWMDIIDDWGITHRFKAEQIKIYEAAKRGCIIQLVNPAEPVGKETRSLFFAKKTGVKRLFKNVGFKEFAAIMKEGILPISRTKNNNWADDKKRAPNSQEVVYLFEPKTKNYIPDYGYILLEVKVENAIRNDLTLTDPHGDEYDEYVVDEVRPDQIKAVYIPEVFKDRNFDALPDIYKEYYEYETTKKPWPLEEFIPAELMGRVTFVKSSATAWMRNEDGSYAQRSLTEAELDLFGKTALIHQDPGLAGSVIPRKTPGLREPFECYCWRIEDMNIEL